MKHQVRIVGPAIGAFVVAAAIACYDDLGPNISGVPAYAISTVEIAPDLDTIFVTDSLTGDDRAFFTAEAIGKNGKPLSIADFVWESSNPDVAIVDQGGVVTALSEGTTEITASAGKIGRAILVVAPATGLVQITPALDTIVTGATIEPAADTVRLTARAVTYSGVPLSGVRFTWESLSPNVATVDQTGLVHAISVGSAGIRARATGAQATATVIVRLVP
jgi:hypothetical protein